MPINLPVNQPILPIQEESNAGYKSGNVSRHSVQEARLTKSVSRESAND